jgi:NAD-dependent deacetylase
MTQGGRGTVNEVARWLAGSRRITVFTGAGINAGAAPDPRGPNGEWARDRNSARLYTLKAYLSDPEVRREAWRNRRRHAAWEVAPNRAHQALVELENAGRLRAIITQNIDGLHQRAGNSDELVIELHGSLYEVECTSCGSRFAMADVLDRVDDGEEDPPCLACGGILKSATISFGQPLVPAVLDSARRAVAEADLFIVVGSSLSLQPSSALMRGATDAGARIVIVNPTPTAYDHLAAAVLRGPISVVLPELVAEVAPLGA